MQTGVMVIAATAATLGFVHTVIGPDHYLPFVMIGRARNWSRPRLAVITALCGLGHVLSSIVLGFAGVALGVAVAKLEGIEGIRGDIASWALMGFGLAYALWGLRRGWLGKTHSHGHFHADGSLHDHEHHHVEGDHRHLHEGPDKATVTVWALFIIFVLGPCEPLIPLLMVPAAEHSMWGVAFVSLVFGSVTITTMVVMTLLLNAGLRLLPLAWMERYVHALAGSVIALSGAAIVFLGL